MFKIIRKNCCGLDVHKTWIFACIGITDANGLTDYKEARFSSFSKGLHELADWLAKYDCRDICMDSCVQHSRKNLLGHARTPEVHQAAKGEQD